MSGQKQRKRRPNMIHTERTFETTGGHATLKLLPHGTNEATVVEARLKRPGADQYGRARHLETTAPVDKLGLPQEAIEALEAKRAKLDEEGAGE